MPEKWKSAVCNKKTFGALLTDLSKAFDLLSQERLSFKIACLWIQHSCSKTSAQVFDKQETKN